MQRFIHRQLLLLLMLLLSTAAFSQSQKWLVLKLKDGQTNSFFLRNTINISTEKDSIVVSSADLRIAYPKISVLRYYITKDKYASDEIISQENEGIKIIQIAQNTFEITNIPLGETISVYGSNGTLYMQNKSNTTSNIISLQSAAPGVYIIYAPSVGSIKIIRK